MPVVNRLKESEKAGVFLLEFAMALIDDRCHPAHNLPFLLSKEKPDLCMPEERVLL